jgi:glucuronate isomerase
MRKINVKKLCNTEDPIDSFQYYQKSEKSDFEIKVSTAFRPDKAVLIENDTYNNYLNKLAEAADVSTDSYEDLKNVLKSRIEYFHENGCRLYDHELNYSSFEEASDEEVASIFNKRRKGENILELETGELPLDFELVDKIISDISYGNSKEYFNF